MTVKFFRSKAGYPFVILSTSLHESRINDGKRYASLDGNDSVSLSAIRSIEMKHYARLKTFNVKLLYDF